MKKKYAKKEEIKCLGTFDKLNVLIKKLNV